MWQYHLVVVTPSVCHFTEDIALHRPLHASLAAHWFFTLSVFSPRYAIGWRVSPSTIGSTIVDELKSKNVTHWTGRAAALPLIGYTLQSASVPSGFCVWLTCIVAYENAEAFYCRQNTGSIAAVLVLSYHGDCPSVLLEDTCDPAWIQYDHMLQ